MPHGLLTIRILIELPQVGRSALGVRKIQKLSCHSKTVIKFMFNLHYCLVKDKFNACILFILNQLCFFDQYGFIHSFMRSL